MGVTPIMGKLKKTQMESKKIKIPLEYFLDFMQKGDTNLTNFFLDVEENF